LIWLALSWQARPRSFRKQIERQEKFLAQRLAGERATLKDVLEEVGHPYHEAVWMLQLMIEQTENEKRWISRLLKDAGKRAPARQAKPSQTIKAVPLPLFHQKQESASADFLR
jgi:hypothetical protein